MIFKITEYFVIEVDAVFLRESTNFDDTVIYHFKNILFDGASEIRKLIGHQSVGHNKIGGGTSLQYTACEHVEISG